MKIEDMEWFKKYYLEIAYVVGLVFILLVIVIIYLLWGWLV